MDHTHYQLLHVAAALLVFLGLGGMLSGQGSKVFAMLHGIGMLALLVAGIGTVHNSPELAAKGWQHWMSAKAAIWVLLGALPFLVKRGVIGAVGAVVLVVGLGATAVWLAQSKPF